MLPLNTSYEQKDLMSLFSKSSILLHSNLYFGRFNQTLLFRTPFYFFFKL